MKNRFMSSSVCKLCTAQKRINKRGAKLSFNQLFIPNFNYMCSLLSDLISFETGKIKSINLKKLYHKI